MPKRIKLDLAGVVTGLSHLWFREVYPVFKKARRNPVISNRKSALLSELQNHLRFTCVALTVNRIRLMLAALAATFLILAAIKTMIGCETIASLGSGRQRLMAVAIALALLLPADVRSQTAPQTHSQ